MVNIGAVWLPENTLSSSAKADDPVPRDVEIANAGDYWIPAFASMTAVRGGASILRGKDPVAAGLQADDFAGLQFPVAGRVDLDHGLALAARERNLGPLDRAERADMAHRAFQRTRP